MVLREGHRPSGAIGGASEESENRRRQGPARRGVKGIPHSEETRRWSERWGRGNRPLSGDLSRTMRRALEGVL